MNQADGRVKLRTCKNAHSNDPSKAVLVPKSCCYCNKVFVNSSYLLKHLLRRHSENFLAVHRKCLKHEVTDEKITRCIQAEFTALRKELALNKASAKDDDLVQHRATKAVQCSYSQNPDTVDGRENVSAVPGSKIFSQRIREDPGRGKYVDLEKDVKTLSEKLNAMECKIVTKRDLRDLLTANENKVFRTQEEKLLQCKRDILNEMNFVLQKGLNKVSLNGENQFLELKQEIFKITSDVDKIKQYMNFSEKKKEEFEKELEEKIIRFLDVSSTKKKKQKAANSQHDDKVSGDFARSNSSISLINDDVPKISSEVTFNLPAKSSGFIPNRQERNKMQETFHVPRNESHLLDFNYDEISAIVSAEMQSLEIPPSKTRLSNCEFLAKKNNLHVKYTHLFQKKNFAQTYNKMNKIAQRKTKSRFHKKNLKVTFDLPSHCQNSFHRLKTRNSEGCKQFQSTPLPKEQTRNCENSHVTFNTHESSLLKLNHEINPRDASQGFSDLSRISKTQKNLHVSFDALESSLLKPNHETSPRDESQGFSDFCIRSKSTKNSRVTLNTLESSYLQHNPEINPKDAIQDFSDFSIRSKSQKNSELTLDALESSLLQHNDGINPKDASQGFSDLRIRSKSQDFNSDQSSQFFSKQFSPVMDLTPTVDHLVYNGNPGHIKSPHQNPHIQPSAARSNDFNFPPEMEHSTNNGNSGCEKSPEQNRDICLSDASSLESWSSADQKDD